MKIGNPTWCLVVAALAFTLIGCSPETTTAPVQEFPPVADAVTMSASPDGAAFAVWTKHHEILLVNSGGGVLRKIGIHGAAPLFSHDGRYVAYEKLGDTSTDGDAQSLFETARGIAVYDVKLSQEVLVTNGGGDDYAPVGFSDDLNLLYFNSTRPYADSSGDHVASLWVVNLGTGALTRLTNADEAAVRNGRMIPTISPTQALWSSDRRTVITSYGPETGVWQFALKNENASAFRVADGDAPHWLVPDKSIAVRTMTNGATTWQTVQVR